ncbi:MAG: recombinase family protein, partial [Fusobacteriaceae bacterium]
MKKLKAIIYVRVSTTMQEDGDSLIYQKKKCEDFCALKGYEITQIIEDVESGANDDRVGFLELQKEIRNTQFDILVVYESSRLSRKTLTMLNFVMELEKNNIKFTSISQPELDTTTPTGMLFFQIQAGLSEYERKQVSSRVKSSKFQRAKDGKWQGGNLPYGYKKDNVTGAIIEDEKAAHEVRAMFHHYLSTQSLSQTARAFNRSPGSMSWILKNEFYLGKLAYGKKEKNINTGVIKNNSTYNLFVGAHPQIVETNLFEAVQGMLIIKKRVIDVEGKLLFTGILRCMCGHKMYKVTKLDKGVPRVNYACDSCNKSIAYKKAEEAIIEELLKLEQINELDDEPFIDDPILTKRLEVNNEIISRSDSERKKIIELYKKEILTSEELELEITDIKNKIDAANKEIKNITNIIEMNKKSETYESNLQILKNVLRNMEDQDRNDIHK